MADDLAGPVGPVDYHVLTQIRDLLRHEEPLIETTSFDDPINPTELSADCATGLETPGRFDITWWRQGAYRFHYTEPDGIDFRFDNHPKDRAPDAHFHPPPDAGAAVPSVLTGTTQPQVITRAVLTQWRRAIVEKNELSELNTDTQ